MTPATPPQSLLIESSELTDPLFSSKQRPPLVIFAIGNPSRGDDALGPELLRLLELEAGALIGKQIEIIEDFQLQIEHALDLDHRELVLFIDASVSCTPPFEFTRLSPRPEVNYTTHAMHPAGILQTYQTWYGSPPPTFLLSIRGEQFDLGQPLSQPASQHLQAAWTLLKQLLETIETTAWEAKVC